MIGTELVRSPAFHISPVSFIFISRINNTATIRWAISLNLFKDRANDAENGQNDASGNWKQKSEKSVVFIWINGYLKLQWAISLLTISTTCENMYICMYVNEYWLAFVLQLYSSDHLDYLFVPIDANDKNCMNVCISMYCRRDKNKRKNIIYLSVCIYIRKYTYLWISYTITVDLVKCTYQQAILE